jgi:hypothetical protein
VVQGAELVCLKNSLVALGSLVLTSANNCDVIEPSKMRSCIGMSF